MKTISTGKAFNELDSKELGKWGERIATQYIEKLGLTVVDKNYRTRLGEIDIIAKVTRDRYMKSLDDEFPGYGFGIHKGYYTELHKEAIEQQGVTPLHRKSFEPIKSIVRWVKPE